MKKTKKETATGTENPKRSARSRKAIEGIAAFGLIIVAAGIAAPFTDLSNTANLRVYKWIYAAGAFIYTIARLVGSTDPDESMRLRRLRRLEFWAGVAFCIGAFFWFYNEDHFSVYLEMGFGTMSCLRDTVYFTLAGGVIQVLAVFAISRRLAKENKENLK